MKMQDSQSVPANSSITVDLKNMRTLTRHSLVRIAVIGAAAGLRCTAMVGSDTVIHNAAVNPANRFPIDPDDFYNDVGVPLDQIDLTITNTTGAAVVGNWAVEVRPVA